jgi:hypothetical protein
VLLKKLLKNNKMLYIIMSTELIIIFVAIGFISLVGILGAILKECRTNEIE